MIEFTGICAGLVIGGSVALLLYIFIYLPEKIRLKKIKKEFQKEQIKLDKIFKRKVLENKIQFKEDLKKINEIYKTNYSLKKINKNKNGNYIIN
jgi:type III secretory pathway component EscR